MSIKRDEKPMKNIPDFDNYQDYIDYLKEEEVDMYNNLLEFVVYINKMTDNNYTVSDIADDTELFYSWYELL